MLYVIKIFRIYRHTQLLIKDLSQDKTRDSFTALQSLCLRLKEMRATKQQFNNRRQNIIKQLNARDINTNLN